MNSLMKGATMFLTGATLGTTLTFGTINTFNGSDLETLEQHVSNYQEVANGVVDDLEKDWSVQIESANAEIGDYKQALAQANENILTLKDKATTLNDTWQQISNSQQAQITQQEQQLADKESEIADLEQGMTDLESNYNEELARLEEQQKATDEENQAKIDELINQANAEIKKAEDEIAELKGQIVSNIEDDELYNYNRPTFELEDENDKTVIDTELDFTMPNVPDEDDTTTGTTPPTTDEEVGTPTIGTIAFIEVELHNIMGTNFSVDYDGMTDLPIYQQNGTNKFRIELSDLNTLPNGSTKVLNVSYLDNDFNDVYASVTIKDYVNPYVGEWTPSNMTGLSETGIKSLKFIVE